MSLIEKLKPKQGTIAVINSPKNILSEFKSLKPIASIPAGKASVDFALLFATNSKELEPEWKRIIPTLKADAVFWVAYPKKSLRYRDGSGQNDRRLLAFRRFSVVAGRFCID